MKTKRWFVDVTDELSTNDPQIAQAAALLRENEVVAFPTETVYGLGANAKIRMPSKKYMRRKGGRAIIP